ncbi:craniofacial development protein 2-like [Branchiostoma lanceolatum]|uniref:craniofacial development protein 2-like n=1 Tax=Branchiostoma lanceolatum TaxID=7740 RepID=UPI0034546F00
MSETRWTGQDKKVSDNMTFIYSGGEHHEYGVGLLLAQEASKALISWQPVSDRIIYARFNAKHMKVSVIQVYACTEAAEDESKDDFYEQLQTTLDNTPKYDMTIVMGDFNAKLPKNRTGWENILGPHGSAEANDNGQRMLEFCQRNNLQITNTYFKQKRIHKATWKSPDGKTENEIDYVCVNKRWATWIHDTRVQRGADIGSDHHMLLSKIKIKLKKRAKKNWVLKKVEKNKCVIPIHGTNDLLFDQDFADDIALIENSEDGLQQATDDTRETAGRVGLKFNAKKCEVMGINTAAPPNIKIEDTAVKRQNNKQRGLPQNKPERSGRHGKREKTKMARTCPANGREQNSEEDLGMETTRWKKKQGKAEADVADKRGKRPPKHGKLLV